MNVDATVSEQIEIAFELDRRLFASRCRTRLRTQRLEVATDMGAGKGLRRPERIDDLVALDDDRLFYLYAVRSAWRV
jgi:hypothetical protein